MELGSLSPTLDSHLKWQPRFVRTPPNTPLLSGNALEGNQIEDHAAGSDGHHPMWQLECVRRRTDSSKPSVSERKDSSVHQLVALPDLRSGVASIRKQGRSLGVVQRLLESRHCSR